MRQPLPQGLAEKLAAFSAGKPGDTPLLDVPSKPYVRVYRALKRAGIPKWGPGGKVDFHALRTAYTTLAIEAGANVKEAQELARHSTPDLTMNVHGRARLGRLQELAESVGRTVLGPGGGPTVAQQKIACAGGADVTPMDNEVTPGEAWWRRGESNPRPVTTQLEPLRA